MVHTWKPKERFFASGPVANKFTGIELKMEAEARAAPPFRKKLLLLVFMEVGIFVS